MLGGQDKREEQRAEYESRFPIVDHSALHLFNSEQTRRNARAAKYDNPTVKISLSANISGGMVITHWQYDLTPLPVKRSRAIVLAEVMDAQAHLSNDRLGIYSEFTIRIDEVFKTDGSISLETGRLLTVERQGGRIRTPSGTVQLYQVWGQGMPRLGDSTTTRLNRHCT
jgi:hypothetical protein